MLATNYLSSPTTKSSVGLHLRLHLRASGSFLTKNGAHDQNQNHNKGKVKVPFPSTMIQPVSATTTIFFRGGGGIVGSFLKVLHKAIIWLFLFPHHA